MGSCCLIRYEKFVSCGFATGFLSDRTSFGLVPERHVWIAQVFLLVKKFVLARKGMEDCVGGLKKSNMNLEFE